MCLLACFLLSNFFFYFFYSRIQLIFGFVFHFDILLFFIFFLLFLLIIWQILLAEISQPNLRGMLIGVPFVSYSCGILIVYGLGSLLDWRTVAWCGLLLPVFSFIAIILGPESPTWLARMGYYDKASKGNIIKNKNKKKQTRT